MTDRAEIIARLQAVFRKTFYDPSIELADTSTVDDIDGWDSLSHVKLMMNAEREFGIEFDPDETARLSNVGALVSHIAGRLPQ